MQPARLHAREIKAQLGNYTLCLFLHTIHKLDYMQKVYSRLTRANIPCTVCAGNLDTLLMIL